MTMYLIATTLFSDPLSNIRVIATNISSCAVCNASGFISTYWIYKEYQRIIKQNAQINTDNANVLSLEEILRTKDGFDLFANHLVKEFSTENLLFLFQMVQIKQQAVVNKLRSI